MSEKKYLLWSEKYRPKRLEKIIGQDNVILSLEKMINNNSLPHLLFYGISGTGKTSTIMSLAKKLYGNNMTMMIMRLDASDDRGINSVREEIKGFAEKMTIFNRGIKLIILDEADSMTFDAQSALRRIIEKYSDNTRFCLICNYENKIIPAIKSRCANFKFNPIDNNFIVTKLTKISKKENLNIDNESLNIIANLSNGDLRKAINLLQSISMRSSKVNKKLCYDVAGYPDDKVIDDIFVTLLDKKKDFLYVHKKLNNILENGYSVSVIFKVLVKCILHNIEKLDDSKCARIFSELSDLEAKVAKSTFGDIYLYALISIFKN